MRREAYAARRTRVSSTEPSTGTSPATLTIAVSDSSDDVGDRLEQLLVAPARLARLLVQVHRRVPALLEQRAQVAQQRRLARIGGLPVARRGDLVDADAGRARGARVDREPGLAAVVLGDGERDPLERRHASRLPWRSSERKRA